MDVTKKEAIERWNRMERLDRKVNRVYKFYKMAKFLKDEEREYKYMVEKNKIDKELSFAVFDTMYLNIIKEA